LSVQQHLFVGIAGMALLGGNKAGAEVSQIRPEQLRGQNLVALVGQPASNRVLSKN
jgi:hypothetical protein